MSEKTYNGWTNYESWVTALWMNNEESTQTYWREQAEECIRECGGELDQASIALAERIKEDHESALEQLTLPGVFADLMNAAMSEVNWREIAQNIIGGFDKLEIDELLAEDE